MLNSVGVMPRRSDPSHARRAPARVQGSGASLSGSLPSQLLGQLQAGPFRITHKQYAPTFRQPVHAHPVAVIDFNLAGSGKGVCGRAPIESRPGVVEFYHAHREHSFECGPSGIRTLHVAFDAAVLQEPEAHTAARMNDPAGPGIDQARASGLAARLLMEVADPDASSPLEAESLAHELIGAVCAWSDKPHLDARWLSWVREHLHETAGAPVTLARLAQRAGVHRSHLARSFAAHYGISIGAYQRRLRLAGAIQRLARQDLPLAALSVDAGFADQAHFSRWCRRVSGITPGAWARCFARERRGLCG